MPKFLRRIYNRYSKLGKKRKSKRVWRKPKGRDNKMREKRRGYGPVVSIGYKNPAGNFFPIVKDIKELKNFAGEKIILGKMGKRKKIYAAKIAKENNIYIINLNKKLSASTSSNMEGTKNESK